MTDTIKLTRVRAWPDAGEHTVGGVRPQLDSDGPEPAADRWGRSERTFERLAPLESFLFDHWFRTELRGLENIPAGGALLVANHGGAIPPDAMQIQWGLHKTLRRSVYVMGENVFARIPFAGRLMRRMGVIEAGALTARKLLGEEGRLGLVFPEGTKGSSKPLSQRYRLQRFGRGGYVRMAMSAGVPIVPVAVMGAEEAMPLLGLVPGAPKLLGLPYLPVTTIVPVPAKIRIRFLEPVDVSSAASDEHSVHVISNGIREVIQDAVVDLVARRRSVLLG